MPKSNKNKTKKTKEKNEKPEEIEKEMVVDEKEVALEEDHVFVKKEITKEENLEDIEDKEDKVAAVTYNSIDEAETKVNEDSGVVESVSAKGSAEVKPAVARPEASYGVVKEKKKKGKRKNTDKEKIDNKITEIYENADGSMPDMQHFQKRKRNKFLSALLTLFGSIGLLAVVFWVVFFVFQTETSFSEEDVILSISGEETVVVGEELTYRVRYRNAQNTSLKNVVLQVHYPEGFVFAKSSLEPTGENNDKWDLASLSGQDSGYIDISGRMYGSLDQKQSFRAFLNYTPENFSSEFQKADTVAVGFDEIPIDFVIKHPEEVIIGSEVEIDITADLLLDEPIENLAIEIEDNNIFNKKSSSLESDQFEDFVWSIAKLEDEFNLKVTGSFAKDTNEKTNSIKVKLIGWKDADKTIEPYIYAEKDVEFNFLETNLSANLVINGATKELNVEPGETLNSSVILKNAGDTPLKSVSVRTVFDAPSANKKSILNWSEILDEADGDIVGEQLNNETRRGIIAWDRGEILDLRQLDPGEELIIDFSLPIKSFENTDLSKFTTTNIEATLEVQYELEGEPKIYSSNPIKMKLNSDTEFEVRDEIGEKKGKEVHTVTWLLTNRFHELSDLRIEADIYGDVSVDKNKIDVPAGEIEYDNENKKLVWTIESMPVSLDVLALQFDIVINGTNPSQTNLTSKVSVQATDVISGERVVEVGDEILLGSGE